MPPSQLRLLPSSTSWGSPIDLGMPPVVFRGGWKPTPPEQPRVRLTPALRAGVAPVAVNWGKGLPVIGMHLNDQWGCCTCAADANIIEQQTYFGSGKTNEAVIPDSAVLKAYESVGGFNPNSGPPGQNPTDQGATVASALAYLKKTGMAGKKIAGYGDVEVTEIEKLKTAIWEFGGVSVGLNLPASAMTQFNNGQVWSVVKDEGQLDGHCVYVCGYNPDGFLLYTWDALWYMTNGFWNCYAEEAWSPISTYWVNGLTGKDPVGVDRVTLGEEFKAVTGQDPFPAPTPPVPNSSQGHGAPPAKSKRASFKEALRRLRFG